jgi:hypothetical protein
LPCASQAAYDASESDEDDWDPFCLDGTRSNVLQQIQAWLFDNGKPHIFWLSGWAGTGKTTIARTVADRHKKCLGAIFFFSRGKEHVSHSGEFFTTIAVQLAEKFPDLLEDSIYKAASNNRDVASKTQKEQWRLLISGPLSKLEAGSTQEPLLLVIDALDECDNELKVKQILDILLGAATVGASRLRVFLTSRPDPPIMTKFQRNLGILHEELVLQKEPPETVKRDISAYFTSRLDWIQNQHSNDLEPGWPGQAHVDHLVSQARGLFIYAATTCRFIRELIEDYPADDVLALVLPSGDSERALSSESTTMTIHESPTRELDMMYTQILEHQHKHVRNESNKGQLSAVSRQILGAIVTLFNPLPLSALAELVALKSEFVRKQLNHLRSILDVPRQQEKPIELSHPSFRDFLLNRDKCSNSNFWVEEKDIHKCLAENCIRLMSKTFKKDIYQIHTPGSPATSVESTRIQQYPPLEVQYACLYWIQHLQKSSTQLRDNDKVHQFLQEHLLHWLETLGWMGKTSKGILAILLLEAQISVSFLYDISSKS